MVMSIPWGGFQLGDLLGFGLVTNDCVSKTMRSESMGVLSVS